MNCLQLTLYPSLTLTLLDENYVKKFGVKKGTRA
ncbi:MAG: DNA lyase, partial [Pyrobaculum sp.]